MVKGKPWEKTNVVAEKLCLLRNTHDPNTMGQALSQMFDLYFV